MKRQEQAQIDGNTAAAILEESAAITIFEEYAAKHEFGSTDWSEIEECLDETLAWALFMIWRANADDPGFNQPSGSLVRAVEELIGGEVWA